MITMTNISSIFANYESRILEKPTFLSLKSLDDAIHVRGT